MSNPDKKLNPDEIVRDFALEVIARYENHHSDFKKKEQMIVNLIQARAISLDSNEKGVTLLDFAIAQKANSIVDAIIKAGANLDKVHPTQKTTALMRCVMSDNIPAFQMLIQAGANWKFSHQTQRIVVTREKYKTAKAVMDLRTVTNEYTRKPSQETKKYVNDFLDCMEEKEKLSMSTASHNQASKVIKKDSHKI